MLKLLSVLILVACAQSAIVEAEETTLEVPTWENLIKCLNEVKPLFPHIKKMIYSVKTRDFQTALAELQIILKDGKTAIETCIGLIKVENLQFVIPAWLVPILIDLGWSILKELGILGIEWMRPHIIAWLKKHKR